MLIGGSCRPSRAWRIYGTPSERLIGSTNALRDEQNEQGGSIVYLAEPDSFDDGPTKPVRIWTQGWTVVSIRDDWTVFDDPADIDRG